MTHFSLIAKTRWYKNRIAAMSLPEIAHRVQEILKRRYDKRYSHINIPPPHDRGHLHAIPGLREGLQNGSIPTELIAQWQEDSVQAQAAKFFLLNQTWSSCMPDKKWHLDPASGQFWPHNQFCFDIDFRHAQNVGKNRSNPLPRRGRVRVGANLHGRMSCTPLLTSPLQGEGLEIKYVWELNRLQYLQPIAALALIQNDTPLAYFCLNEIESWIDNNPPHQGVNWASGIELALRAISILFVTSCVGEHLTSTQRAKIWGTLEAHATWIERYPSLYSSANNHLTAEGLGLFVIGTLCPELPGALRWKENGWRILCNAARHQILPDGTGAEQSLNYTARTVEMLLLAWHIAKATDIVIPDDYMLHIEQAGHALHWFTDPSGHYPRIGDDDDACILGKGGDENYINSIAGCITAVTRNPELAPPNCQPHLRQVLFGTISATTIPHTGMQQFDNGGYTVIRHRTAKEILLAMDHGYLGYLSIAAHGHADALAIWLHIDGQPVLVDAGTYLYHSGGEWRDYFRSTRAHNTLCLENTDSSTMSGPFNWSHKANARCIASDADARFVEAEHDGYLKKFGAIHRRRLDTGDSGFSVTDWLIADKPHHVDIGFMLHPSLNATPSGNDIIICRSDTTILRLRHESPLTPHVHSPQSPDCGWYSPSFGLKIPATRIVFSGTIIPQQKAITRFFYD